MNALKPVMFSQLHFAEREEILTALRHSYPQLRLRVHALPRHILIPNGLGRDTEPHDDDHRADRQTHGDEHLRPQQPEVELGHRDAHQAVDQEHDGDLAHADAQDAWVWRDCEVFQRHELVMFGSDGVDVHSQPVVDGDGCEDGGGHCQALWEVRYLDAS